MAGKGNDFRSFYLGSRKVIFKRPLKNGNFRSLRLSVRVQVEDPGL